VPHLPDGPWGWCPSGVFARKRGLLAHGATLRETLGGPIGWPKASVGATKYQYKTHSWSKITFFIFSELAFKRQVPFTRSNDFNGLQTGCHNV
jgi:hypothetical protein